MKIVTLCTCGLGTCFILKMKAEEVLEKLGINCEIVSCDLSGGSLEEADIYLLPYGLELDKTSLRCFRVLVIEDVLNDEELENKLADCFEDMKRSTYSWI